MSQFEISFNRKFETAHRFIASCEDSCMTPHGHTWHINFSFKLLMPGVVPFLDLPEAFLCEYKVLKGEMSRFINEIYDHSFFMAKKDPLREKLLEIHPKARILLFPNDPTTEAIAFFSCIKLYNFIKNKKIMNDMDSLRVKILETPTNSVAFALRRPFAYRHKVKEIPYWAMSDEITRQYEVPD